MNRTFTPEKERNHLIALLILFIVYPISFYGGRTGPIMEISKWIPRPLAILDLFIMPLSFVAIPLSMPYSRKIIIILVISNFANLLTSPSISRIGENSFAAVILMLWGGICFIVSQYVMFSGYGIKEDEQVANLAQAKKNDLEKPKKIDWRGKNLTFPNQEKQRRLIFDCLMVTMLQVLGLGTALSNTSSYPTPIRDALIVCGFIAFFLFPIYIIFPRFGGKIYIAEAIYLLVSLFFGSSFSPGPFFLVDCAITLGFVLLFIIPPAFIGFAALKAYAAGDKNDERQ